MTLNAFERIFTNNSNYANYKDIPYMESLAYMVQEFLYTEKAKNREHDYRMDNHIKLFDFMTLTAYIIGKSVDDLGRATIKGYIEDMKQLGRSYKHEEKVEYRDEGLIITCASYELIFALLWASYVYADVRCHLSNSEWWENAKQILYDLMKEYSVYTEKYMKELPPLMHIDQAINLMMKHIHKNQFNERRSLPQKVDSQQEEESNVVEAIEIEWHDKVRLDLLLRLIENDGAELGKRGNKMKAAKLMQSITGLPLQTCKNYCTNRDLNTTVHSEEILKLNTILQALGMKIRL